MGRAGPASPREANVDEKIPSSPPHPPRSETDVEPPPLELGHDVRDEDMRSPSPRPRSPPASPPRDLSSVLGSIVRANHDDSGDVNAVMQANRARTEKERSSAAATGIRDVSNHQFPVGPHALESNERLQPFLFQRWTVRDERRGKKTAELRSEYKVLNDEWRSHCRRLDRIKDRVHRRKQAATVPATPSIDNAGLPFYPDEVSTPGGPALLGRANRRAGNAAFGYGDAVRSEAEFLEILASLETADMRDPDVREARTTATIPDQVVDPSELADLIAFDDNRRSVIDPVEFYGINGPLGLWTDDEVEMFCKRYSQHPKQFGRIAADLPEKTLSQCVLFYYRMKNTIDFRSLSDRRRRDGRRRKARRRVDGEGKAVKAAALMSNLKRTHQDDEDESPPPSPRGGRKHALSVAESPSVFQLPESTSRPGPTPEELSYDEAQQAKGKKGRTLKVRDLLPPSEGMVEAAEVLLAGFAGTPLDPTAEDADDDSATKAKKRRVRLDVDGGDDMGAKDSKDKGPSRRKSASSSYWSVAERNEFVRLLGLFGKDWARLAEGLENKTAVQCRNVSFWLPFFSLSGLELTFQSCSGSKTVKLRVGLFENG